MNEDLAHPGMVTDAIWTDFNNDQWPDLIVVGEWMPIRIFENQKGTLTGRKDISALEKSNGWWSSIHAADIDADGDTDYFSGNAGNNIPFKSSVDQPVQLFAGDFNKDGVIDPVLCYYIQGRSYPLATRDELLDQLTILRKKFIKYADYADATLRDIAGDELIEKAFKFEAYMLESAWLENINGKEFRLHKLPAEAQYSSINSFLFEDFDGDGSNELLAAGNFYPFKAQLGRSDASTGLLLKFENGIVKPISKARTNLWLQGDIRDMAWLNFKSGRKRLVISRNNDEAEVLQASH
jgi:Mor family transcriptional regulator